MLKLLPKAVAGPMQARPTSLLRLVAGEFAPRLAVFWPEPHTEFLTAAAARRHLVCLAIALGADLGDEPERLLELRLRLAIREVFPEPPAGLERALSRLGETAWTARAYRRLAELLADPAAAKLLRHAELIDGAAVERLYRLPDPMGRALHLAAALTDDGATAVSEACLVVAFRCGVEAAAQAARRWTEADSEAALFEAVREDLYPEPPAPPFVGTPRLRPLATKAALREAAKRYDNCLGGRVSYAVAGNSAYYEWTEGDGAVVEIDRDAMFGWRMNEVRGPKNALLRKAARRALMAELAAMGVWVGRSGWQLERALNTDVGRGWRLPTVAEDLADVFGD